MVKKMTRGLCVCLCALLWAGCLPAASRVKAEPQSAQTAEQEKPQAAPSDYTAYLEAHGGEEPSDAQPIILRPSAAETVEGRAAVRLNEGTAALALTFSVPEAGWYRPTVSYCPLSEGASTELITQWTLDGAVPFSEAAAVQLSRVFVNGESRRDGSGNDLRPEQLAVAQWWESPLWDDSGYHAEPFAAPDGCPDGGLSYAAQDTELRCAIARAVCAAAGTEAACVPLAERLRRFCEWVGYDDGTAYIFLLRDTLLPFVYHSARRAEPRPARAPKHGFFAVTRETMS